MQQGIFIQRFIASVALLAAPLTMSDAATVRLVEPRIETEAAQGLTHGIRGFGTGAEVQELAAGATAAARSESNRGAASGLLISGTPMAGNVNGFALSPDGSTAVYIADQETLGRFELYSTPVDGSAAATKISAGLAFGAGDAGVALFRIVSGGMQVVFLADPLLGAGSNELYSVPIDGSAAPIRLNSSAQAPVLALGTAQDGATVAFFGPGTTSGIGPSELYRATIGSAGSAIQLSDASASNSGGNVVAADFSADSSTLVYAADTATDNVFQWYSVALSSPGPGSDQLLSSALGSVSLGSIVPDSTTFVYAADELLLGVAELFSIPLGGGAKTKLNPSMAGSGVSTLRINAEGTHVAYLADQQTSGVVEVFGAQVGVAGSGLRLNSPLAATQSADVLTIAPDAMTVLYEADENLIGTFDLLSAPIDGSVGSATLDAMTPPDNAGSFGGLGTPIVGLRALYPVIATQVDLYSVPFSGAATAIRVNDALAAGDTIRDAFVPTTAMRLIAYGVGPSLGVTTSLFSAPIRGDLPAEQVNNSAAAGSVGVVGYEISSNETHLVYAQDETTPGRIELYSRELDSDQDTVGNATDNCPFIDNIAQTALVFGQTVFATDGETFAWGSAVDARYVRGPLTAVAALATDDSDRLIEADTFTDSTIPSSGDGFYYLFAVDCSGRSYQTALGAESGRDTAGFP